MPKTCESCRFVNKVEAKDLSGNTTFVAFDCTHPALQRGSDVDPGDNGWRTPANYGCTFHKPVKNPREWRVTRLEGQDATRELRKLCRHLKRQAEDTGSSTKYRVRLTKTGIALEISD